MFNELIKKNTQKLINTLKTYHNLKNIFKKVDKKYKNGEIFDLWAKQNSKHTIYDNANNRLIRAINCELGYDCLYRINYGKNTSNYLKVSKI